MVGRPAFLHKILPATTTFWGFPPSPSLPSKQKSCNSQTRRCVCCLILPFWELAGACLKVANPCFWHHSYYPEHRNQNSPPCWRRLSSQPTKTRLSSFSGFSVRLPPITKVLFCFSELSSSPPPYYHKGPLLS